MIASLLVSIALAISPHGDPGCIDPSTPLRQLAADYDRWPAPPGGRSKKAFDLLKEYLDDGSPRTYHRALSEYQWLQSNNPSDPHINLALGVLYTSGPDLNYPGADAYRHNVVSNNSNADDFGAQAMELVASRDSSAWLAAVALTRIALVSPERTRMQQAREAVQAILRHDPENSAARLAWHDLLIAQDSAQKALSFDVAYPMDCTGAKHARAESLLLTGDTAAGAKLYLDALNAAQPDELQRFYDDIRVMASVLQLKLYAAVKPEERSKWIAAFWQRSADAFGRTIRARITEHVVRVTYADIHFRATEFSVSSDRKIAWISDTSHFVPWDVRGVLYVRHGPPANRLRIMDRCNEPFEAWEYTMEDSPWVFWFMHNCLSPKNPNVKRGLDWRPLPGPPPCTDDFQYRPVPTLEETIEKQAKHPERIDERDIFKLLSQYDPRYVEFYNECTKLSAASHLRLAELQNMVGRETRNRLNELEWTEGTPPRLKKSANMTIAAYQFRDAEQHIQLIPVAWVSKADLADSATAQTAVHFTYVLMDNGLKTLRADKEETSESPSSYGGAIRSSVTIPDVSFQYGTLRVIATNTADSTRGAIRSAPVNLRVDPSPQALSDIVLADPNVSDGILQRGAFRLAPLPGHDVPVGSQFRLFVEGYGIGGGENVAITIRLAHQDKSNLVQLLKLFPGKKVERTLSYNVTAEVDSRGIFVQDVNIDGDLVPGAYMVEVTMQPKNGKALSRSTVLYISDPKAR